MAAMGGTRSWVWIIRSNALPRLKCRQGERVREDAGNTVKSAQMIGVGDGCEPRHRVAGESYQISLGRGASDATEFLTTGWSHTRNDLSTN
jgi:hypothetical protein